MLRPAVRRAIVTMLVLTLMLNTACAPPNDEDREQDAEDRRNVALTAAEIAHERTGAGPTETGTEPPADEAEVTETSPPVATVEPTETAEPTSTPEPTPTAEPTATPAPTSTPEPTATPAPPTATPEPAAFSFGEGVKIVGQDIPPGTYRSTGPGSGLFDFCYWERLSGFGGSIEEIIANEFADYRQVVTIKETDTGFNSEGCGEWIADLSPITSDPTAPFGDGVWIVNTDIAPGTWRSETPPEGACYWERLSGFGGELDDIIANQFTDTEQVVTIAPDDAGFHTSGCGTWTYAG